MPYANRAVSDGNADGSTNQIFFTAEHTTPDKPQATKITNRPLITLPLKQCPSCNASYIAAWGWVIPASGRVLDLCGSCARTMRYGSTDERRAVIGRLLSQGREGRVAA